MAAQSKELSEEDQKIVDSCMVHAAMNMFVSVVVYSTRTELLQQLLNGDFAATSQYVAFGTSGAALLEVLLNPTVGALSDTYGRRPFMMMAPWANMVMKAWVVMSPSVFSLTAEKIICDGLRTMTGTTMTGAALSDKVDGSQVQPAH